MDSKHSLVQLVLADSEQHSSPMGMVSIQGHQRKALTENSLAQMQEWRSSPCTQSQGAQYYLG